MKYTRKRKARGGNPENEPSGYQQKGTKVLLDAAAQLKQKELGFTGNLGKEKLPSISEEGVPSENTTTRRKSPNTVRAPVNSKTFSDPNAVIGASAGRRRKSRKSRKSRRRITRRR